MLRGLAGPRPRRRVGPGRRSRGAPPPEGLGRSCPSERPASEEPPPPIEERAPYLARRSAHVTRLHERGPSPGNYGELERPPGVLEVTYPSGELQLKAWLARPIGGYRLPALVYFHGDFAFGADDFEVVRSFVSAGFVVMTPMLRGENGNPGDFELLWGEVDDARAAIEWVAQQPEVDRSRIYAFGHSIGGGVAAMLTLYPELPLRRTGSCGGIYVPETFRRWAASEGNADLVRFDPNDPDETELRVLGPNVAWMVHPHVAYVGQDDPWFLDNGAGVRDRAWSLGKPFDLVMVEGDHMGSLAPALAAFLQVARNDLPKF
ncbi:MAG: prolyl oligopeptidase family serine peptidase [Deltaproteobacteria bacterium]|nr:prolyl oligopeptidase family serine peptidase [Deltaproteobacteria bacterium]